MIYLIINFFINSQTHCGSYIKPSLGNSGLMHFMMLIWKKYIKYIFQYAILMVSSKQVCEESI